MHGMHIQAHFVRRPFRKLLQCMNHRKRRLSKECYPRFVSTKNKSALPMNIILGDALKKCKRIFSSYKFL